MGYESRLMVYERIVLEESDKAIGIKIGEVNMSCLGNSTLQGLQEIIREPIDFDVYVGGETEPRTDDYYGEHIKMGSIPDVVAFLEKEEEKDHYRRFPIAIGMLKPFTNASDWGNGISDYVVLHFGY